MAGKEEKGAEGPKICAHIHDASDRQIVRWQQEPNFQSNHVRTKDQNGVWGVGNAVVGDKYLPLHCLINKMKKKGEIFVGSVSLD